MDIVYGPVQSQRFGTTLGINLLGSQKVCSYNCVYCDLGLTKLTMNKVRKEYSFPTLSEISDSFKTYIRKSVPMDAIVVSGNGEPTLHDHFEEAMQLLVQLRAEHLPGKKIIVLTNGAHLDNKKVVAGLNLADERIVKLDAGNDSFMQKVNEPLIRINVAKLIGGLRKLSDFTIQSLYIQGTVDNTQNEALDEWIEVLGMIKPKAVQICTLSRPAGTDAQVQAVDEDTLYSIAFKLKKRTGLEASVFGIQKA